MYHFKKLITTLKRVFFKQIPNEQIKKDLPIEKIIKKQYIENNKYLVELSLGDKIIRTESVKFEDGLENYLFCSEPVTYLGEKNGRILTDEYGALGEEFSDGNWIPLKNITLHMKNVKNNELEGKYIKRIKPPFLKLQKESINSMVFGIDEIHKDENKDNKIKEEIVFLLFAGKKRFVVIHDEQLKILDERFANPAHWKEVK